MKTASIDYDKLNELCNAVRNMTTLNLKVRRQLVEALLKECDIIARTDVENLMCMSCAARTLNLSITWARRKVQNYHLRVYRLCHKVRDNPRSGGAIIEYLDRREVEAMRKPRPVVKN